MEKVKVSEFIYNHLKEIKADVSIFEIDKSKPKSELYETKIKTPFDKEDKPCK